MEFSSGGELLQFWQQEDSEEIGILFLDISMDDTDGMEAAEQIRKWKEERGEAVWEFRHLKAKKNAEPREILVRSGNVTRNVPVDNIYYIESSNRKIIALLYVIFLLVIWIIFFRPEKEKKAVAFTGIFAAVNVVLYLCPAALVWVRNAVSAAIVLGYCRIKYGRHLEKAAFTLLLFYNFQGMSFLISNSIYQYLMADMLGKFDISVVQIDQEVFSLFTERREMIWKIPVIAVLICIGEISAVYIFQKYKELQDEREKHFVEEQQMKAMKRRLEEAENFYGSIRKVRHEMKSHMANIKGQ